MKRDQHKEPIMTYHIKPNGEIGVCRAEYKCPYGNMLGHDDDREVLRNVYENFMEGLQDPTRSVEFHFVSSDEMTGYTNGDCAHLAKTLLKKVNGELVVLSRSDNISDEQDVWWEHMAVRTPDGRILDVEGLWTDDDLLKKWGNPYPVKLHTIAEKRFKNLQDGFRAFPEVSPVKTANKIFKAISSIFPV